MTVVKYNHQLKQKAKELRRNSTLSEVLLWQRLKNKQLSGYDFHRQKPIGSYIVDFFCPKLNLAIEIDGDTHYQELKHDKARQEDLERKGIKFLRFGDLVVKKNIESVVLEIESWIDNFKT